MSKKKKIQNTVRFEDFSNINGFNSGKNYSITSKLFSTKQYTMYHINSIVAKMAIESMEN